MGNALKGQGKLEDIEAYKQSSLHDLIMMPITMGNALKEQGKLEEAIEA